MRLNKFFVAIHETKQVLTFNKPIYAGFSNLELTKYLMYDFHYNYIKRIYNAKLLFTDIENLVDEIEKNDVYEDFYKDTVFFLILVTIEQIQELFILSIKKVIGKMKDKFKGKIISEFVGLKSSKMYSLIEVDNQIIDKQIIEENKKAKGVYKEAAKNKRHNIMMSCLIK